MSSEEGDRFLFDLFVNIFVMSWKSLFYCALTLILLVLFLNTYFSVVSKVYSKEIRVKSVHSRVLP